MGSVGMGAVHTFENDTGPDDANHSEYGVFLLREPGLEKRWLDDLNILDVAPTILHRYGIPLPAGMHGRVVAPN